MQALIQRNYKNFILIPFLWCIALLGMVSVAQAYDGGTPPAVPAKVPPASSQNRHVPLAGTIISNTATVEFFDPTTGYPMTIESNTVNVKVNAVEALDLVSDQTVHFGPGAPVYLSHRLTNTGNVNSTYQFTFGNAASGAAGDDYDLNNLKLYNDVNGNGLQDSNEPEISPSDQYILTPGASMTLVLAGSIPTNAANDSSAKVNLTATTALGLSATNVDTINVGGGVVIRLQKEVDKATAQQGDTLTYTVNALSIGNGTPLPDMVRVDGDFEPLVIIRDAIPANTEFTGFLDPAPVSPPAKLLYHLRSNPAPDHYVSEDQFNGDNSQVDAVALGVKDWTPENNNLQARFRFTVKVLSGSISQIDNTAKSTFKNAATDATPTTIYSNLVRTTLQGEPTIYYYVDGNFNENDFATSTHAGSDLYLQVDAASCNKKDSNGNDVVNTVKIILVSQKTGDTYEVTATETGVNTGIFRAIVRTENSETAVSGDSVIQTVVRDRIDASIVDCAGQTASTQIVVDPSGVVFDSRTNKPVGDAIVMVKDASGTTTIESMTTGTDGAFDFPNLQPGSYLLVVNPPAGYISPSKIPSSLLPLSREPNPERVMEGGVFVEKFTIAVNGALSFDVPVDSAAPTGLLLEKKVSNSMVEIGDFLEYSLQLKNLTADGDYGGVATSNTIITDNLPQGFSLVPGSVRYIYRNTPGSQDTYKVGPDPVGAPGSELIFRLKNMWPFPGAEPDPGATGYPEAGELPSATLPPGTLTVGANITITYRVRVGAASGTGDAVNRAQGHGETAYGPIDSNTAAAKVLVQSGVLNTRGIIIGKVFVDKNENGIQDEGEDGIPGVRLWLEDGTFVITDSEGKYSVYGLSPRNHVVKLDTVTMPRGSKLSAFDYNHAGSGSTSFADLRMGGMVKVNFAIIDPSEDVLQEIADRREKSAKEGTSLDGAFNRELQKDVSRPINSDQRGQAASGTINNNATTKSGMTIDSVPSAGIASPTISNNDVDNQGGNNTNSALGNMGTSVLTGSTTSMYSSSDSGLTFGEGTLSGALGANSAVENSNGVRLSVGGISPGEQLHGNAVAMPSEIPIGAGNSNLPSAPVRVLAQVPLEDEIKQASNSLAFLNLRNGDVLPIDQSNINIKGAAGAVIKLRVNGEEVPESRIGKKIVMPERQLEARQYISVKLKPGANLLELIQTDMAGSDRGNVKIHVIAPGSLGNLQIYTTQKKLYADGRSDVKVHVKLTDDEGVPVTVRTPLTLETSAGDWDVQDLNPIEPGVQVFLEGGEGVYSLRAPLQSGDSIVKVSSGILGASMRLSFLPELRPLVAAGIVEMRLGNFSIKGGESDTTTLFDEQLRSLAGGDKSTLGGRVAMFLKGRVKGEYLLTMRYDSERDEEDNRLFRDIQPDEYYPIYGDSSIRGYDAQSTSRLYVRIDKNKSYILYGDYTTPQQSLASSLGAYNRSLTGGKLHHQTERFMLDAYASHDSSKQVVDEVPANGTSGPYLLASGGDVVRQSEKVELVTRDRNQLSVILKVQPLTRFSDYSVDGLTRGILFRTPVSSRDADGNPIFIRVTYEVDNGGPRFFVGGISAQFRVTPDLILGGTYAQADDPMDPLKIGSLNAQYRIGRNTLLVAEVAQSDLRSEGKGSAKRIELVHEDAKLQARVLLAQSDENFNNPSSLLSQGQKQAALRASYRLNNKQRVLAEAIYTKDVTSGAERQGVALTWEQTLKRGLRLQLGMRHIKDTGSALIGEDVEFTSLRARLIGQFSHVPLTLFGEYERAISGEGQTLTVGGDYQIANKSRLYFRHRLLDSLTGLDAMDSGINNHATVFGIDSAYMKNGRVFSEYRINDGIDGRSAEAAIGLRNLWTLSRAVRIGTSFERVKNLSGGSSTDTNYTSGATGTAGAIALEYLPRDNFKATARFEARHSDQETSYLGSAGIAYKINRDWSFLARGIVSKRDSEGTTGSGGVDSDGFDLWNGTQMRLQLGAAWRQTESDKWNGLMKYEYVTNTNDAGSIFSAFRQRSHIISMDLNNQLNPRTNIGLHYAWKLTLADGSGLSSKSSAQLLSGRITHDVNQKFQVSLLGGLLKDLRGGDGLQSGLAAELGYRFKRDMTIGIGYSLLGTRDNDLGLDFTKRGPYLRWRWKFDENLFHSPSNNTEKMLAGSGRGVQLVPVALQQAANPEDDNDSILSDEQVKALLQAEGANAEDDDNNTSDTHAKVVGE